MIDACNEIGESGILNDEHGRDLCLKIILKHFIKPDLTRFNLITKYYLINPHYSFDTEKYLVRESSILTDRDKLWAAMSPDNYNPPCVFDIKHLDILDFSEDMYFAKFDEVNYQMLESDVEAFKSCNVPEWATHVVERIESK